MPTLFEIFYWVYDIFVPRFIDEDVVVLKNPECTGTDGWEIICPLRLVRPDEEFDGTCRIKSFTWLGFGFFGKVELPPRPFVNPHKT